MSPVDRDDDRTEEGLGRPMRATFTARTHKGALMLALGLVSALIAAAVLPGLLGSRLTPAQAEQRVRVILSTRVTSSLQADLKRSGRATPDRAMALWWKARLDSVAAIELSGTRVRRPFFDWIHDLPSWVVRTSESDPGGAPTTRYYFLRWGGLDHPAMRVRWWLAR